MNTCLRFLRTEAKQAEGRTALGRSLKFKPRHRLAGAELVAAVSPLPARITWWSVVLAVALGASVGVIFGVYPARRAARLDPITALRAE